MTDAARTPQDASPLSLSVAAVRLGISPDAARKRLERGTLRGEKRAGRWRVWLESDAAASTVQDATSDRDRTAYADRTPPDAASPIGDITPLADLIANLSRENQELAAAAALWQYRALRAEETIAALEAGPIAQDAGDHAPQDVISAPLRDDAAVRASEPLKLSADTLAPGWRRWWRRITGR